MVLTPRLLNDAKHYISLLNSSLQLEIPILQIPVFHVEVPGTCQCHHLPVSVDDFELPLTRNLEST